MSEPRLIKKYPNRRLYDTELSRYITIEDVRALIAARTRPRIVEQRSGADISASESRARTDEEQRDDANRAAAEHFARHHRFAVATSLLQIAIVLETVAAVLDRSPLWWGGLAVGLVGVAALVNGFVGFL